MDVADFDFTLPDELIAQEPPVARSGSRLLILDRATGAVTHATFPAVAQEEGVYFHTLWHSGVSAMHTLEDIDLALERIEKAARRVAAGQG